MTRHANRPLEVLAIGALSTGLMLGCESTDDAEPVTPDSALTSEPMPADLPPTDPSLQPLPAPPAPPTPPASDSGVAAAEPAPREFEPQTDPDEIEGWRPQWWLEEPLKTQHHATACAYASAPELAVARATAVEHARQRLREFLGREPGMTEMKTDALRSPTGEYRAFVLIQTPLK